MRHQVERPKHVAPKHGVKPVCALTAALVAVAMMATMAVTSLTPSRNANAADADNKAGIYKPTSVILGTDTGAGTEDTGIATYVGGDMYVGQKVSGDMKNPSGPAGSYAAEAEGLTAVKGKLLLHPLKGVWTTYYKDADGVKNGHVKDYRGFRFGIVGFGSQYRPKNGSSVLEVRGENSDNDINWVGGAEAWGNAGWIGKDNTKTKEPSYTANIARDPTTVFRGSSNSIPGKYGSADTHKYDSRPSVYVPSDMNGSVNWNRDQKDDNIGNTGKTFSDFRTYINTLSTDLSQLQESESVHVTSAKAIKSSTYKPWQDKLVRTKYDGNYSFTIDSVNERVIQFEGNGTSSMQVFYLPATLLNTDNNTGYTGVSFVFKNIPDSSSVVINVTGDKGYKVDFHNGWRFWWTDPKGNTKELGGSYTDPDYAKRAQQIMWNFADASSVIIRGGQGSGKTTRKDANSAAESADGVWAGSFSLKTKDDPAAGMLGSILVPNGSFESHVSTNGRVWVGRNYAMYNPDAVTGQDGSKFVNYERSYSASALDMDQERHNLPWNGSYSTQGAAIAWDKVDASDPQKKLDNTTWAVYASKSDAQNQSNALKTVTDNAYGDDDSKQGSFSIGGLNPSATYYIREFSANNPAYATNTNIYAITAGGEGSTARVVTNVYDSKGNDIDITDSDKNLLPSAGDNSTNAEIANKKRGTIEWSKVDGTDKETLLGGSAWTLSKMSGETAEQSWNITDDQSGTEVKRITITDANNKAVTSDTPITFEGNNSQKFTATAYDQQNKVITGAKLTWSSDKDTVASVDQNGTVTPKGNGSTTITVKSADGKVTASFRVEVSGVNVTAKQYLTLYFQAQNNWPANNVKVHYQTTNDTAWTDINMRQMDGSCNNYAYANIPLTGSNAIDSTSQFGFKYINGKTGWYSPGNANVPKADNNNFKFTNDGNLPEVVVISAGPSYSTTAPSGCAVTSTVAYSSRRVAASSGEHRAVASVLRSQSNVVNVEENNTVSSKKDEDTAAGKFKVSDLVDGTYRLQETTAPNGYENGYEKSKTEYWITITDGNASWSSTDGNASWSSSTTDPKIVNIVNKRKTGTVTWTKMSSDPNNTEPLPGSQWTLKQTKTFSWENGVAKYTDADATLGTVTDCVSGKNNVTDRSAQTGTYVDLDGAEGEFKISGLGWGEYELIESKAPDGYNIDSKPHTFRIGPAEGSDVTGKWYTSSGGFKTDSTDVYNADTAFTVNGGSITNTPGVVLPDTGGEGLNKMYAAGFLAVAIAVAGLALSLRRRQ